MNHYEALPPDYNGQKNLAETPPAIVQEIPADQDPTKWEERLQNDLNQSLEGLGESVAALETAEREARENEERINALQESECADHGDPPHDGNVNTETGEDLNGD